MLVGLALAGLSVSVPASFAPADRWAISVVGIAALCLGFAIRRGAGAFGAIGAAIVVGWGAQLYLTEPLWFPALRLRPLDLRDVTMMALLGAEAALAMAMIVRFRLWSALRYAGRRLGWVRMGVAAAIIFLSSAPIIGYLDRDAIGAWIAHLIVTTGLMAVHGVLFIGMLHVRPPLTGAHRIRPIGFAAVASIVAFLLSVLAFQSIPHVEDEVAYLFQAHTLADGSLWVPAPPEAAWPGLEYYLFEIRDGRWFSTTLPGWPAALALGLIVGAEWLLNPLLTGLCVLLGHGVVRRMTNTETADRTAMLMALSPWMLAAGATMMPHMLTLALALVSWWLILRAGERHRRSLNLLFLAGCAMGWIFCARPLDGIILGAATGIWLLFKAGRDQRVTHLLAYGAGCVAIGSLLLIYNAAMTGSPLTLPLSAYLDRHWSPGANAFGFGADIGPPGKWGALDLWHGHGPVEAALNTLNLIFSLQFELFGWPIGSLLPLLGFLLWTRRRNDLDRAMVVLLVTVVGVMALYWFAESYYVGPRYWFPAALPILYLSARGIDALLDRLEIAETGHLSSGLWFLCALGLLVFLPWRAVMKYHEYGDFHTAYRDAVDSGIFGNAVVVFQRAGNEGSAFMLNDPLLRDGPILIMAGPDIDDAALSRAFPGREIVHFSPDWQSTDPSGRNRARYVSRNSSRER